MAQTARLILCADDYALAPGVSRAIRQLIAAGRITATSCMTLSPFWPEHASALRDLADRADIGLHLTLTDHAPLGTMPRMAPGGRMPPVGRLLAATLARRIAAAEIAAELERQLDAFERAFGRPPDFIDGHQHVHQFPGIRDQVIGLWRRRLAATCPWIRVCDASPGALARLRRDSPKLLVIGLLGRAFRRRVEAAGIPANDRFAGVHDFTGRIPYARHFEGFIAAAAARTLVMCHPGEVDAELLAADPVAASREEELRFLMGPGLPAALARRGIVLGRFG